ncbi:DUF4349 domain-containing protein [Leptospira sarikeiensis]|uniref:DUF4349 domain-containing protein n=1 Tax=Leptospira sarikeiensis TaxID=2484943 RepID=A0A4R9K7X3_9LEPT|nr:DUF4349 domain-containing protein [Leptospira sarikeiensis]TGL61546.1 DUF4349 domain-containing protein [Leptospira sarikeiensis]
MERLNEISKFIKKFSLGFACVFLILFLFRLAYSYAIGSESQNVSQEQGSSTNFDYGRKNYASEKFYSPQDAKLTLSSSQKYEKVAAISSKTSEFEEDEKKIRKNVEDAKGVIQYEQRSGLAGRRTLQLGIGVNPDGFDSMVESIQKIGVIDSISVNKTDKTNEYKDITATRISLEKSKAGLLSLKGRNGKIEELISLEKEILEIEGKIQDLGVKLGEFDQENEFCTIKFTLKETGAVSGGFVTFLKKCKISLEWTIKYGLFFFFLYSFAAVGAWISWFLGTRILDYLKAKGIL